MDAPPTGRHSTVPPVTFRPGSIWLRHLVIAGGSFAIVFLALSGVAEIDFRLLSAWTVALVSTLVAIWIFILRSTPEVARARARAADPGGVGILVVFVFASLASLLGAIFVVAGTAPATSELVDRLELWMVLLAVAAGWFLMHTAFALHYARLYWGGAESGGLVFPGEEPDDVDFAYFAFGVGMAFQVSDVTTTTTSMRRTVLLHATLSFVYNSAILALTINLLAGRF